VKILDKWLKICYNLGIKIKKEELKYAEKANYWRDYLFVHCIRRRFHPGTWRLFHLYETWFGFQHPGCRFQGLWVHLPGLYPSTCWLGSPFPARSHLGVLADGLNRP
jgi:hypothetical protein